MRWWKQRHREASPPVVQVRRTEGHPFGVLDRYTPLGGGSVELYRAIREGVPLLDAAIWSVIQQNSDSLDTYERDEVGAMYLPTLDIDRAVASLYGPDFHFNYETFTDNGLTFQYVPEKNAYLLPITSVNGNYSPRVMQIRREGSTKRVTVGYLDLYGSGEIVFDPTKLEPAKYMDYIFTRSGDAYYLTAITESEMKAESQTGSVSSGGAQAPVAPQDQVMDNVASALPESVAPAQSGSASESTTTDPASAPAE